MANAILDWTQGTHGIAYQQCSICGRAQYFRRAFCAACGSAETVSKQTIGTGVVLAATTVHRAPSDALRAFAPYTIALVTMSEGFTLMAHARTGVQIGDRVKPAFIDFGGTLIPCFSKIES